MARAYDRLARLFHPQKNIMFADSIIYLTEKLSHITYPIFGYMLKGHWYQHLGNLELAVKNSLKGLIGPISNRFVG